MGLGRMERWLRTGMGRCRARETRRGLRFTSNRWNEERVDWEGGEDGWEEVGRGGLEDFIIVPSSGER